MRHRDPPCYLPGGVFLIEVRSHKFAGLVTTNYAQMPSGQEVYIADEAKALLGLTPEQAEALFEPDNTIEDVRRIVAEIKAGEEAPLSGWEYRAEEEKEDDAPDSADLY